MDEAGGGVGEAAEDTGAGEGALTDAGAAGFLSKVMTLPLASLTTIAFFSRLGTVKLAEEGGPRLAP